MSAMVIDLAPYLARRPSARQAKTARPSASATLKNDFTFWRGATGQRYVHTIYPLFECPELPAANVMLVRRHASGRVEVMLIGRVEHTAQSLNLAEVRRKAATLGANEVHVHLLAASASERLAIERDLSGAGETTIGAATH